MCPSRFGGTRREMAYAAKNFQRRKKIDPQDIDQILKEKIMGVEGTTVLLKNGEREILLHSEREVLEEMNKAMRKTPGSHAKTSKKRP
jgi:hypothetical protein